jgi:hypothetical protein
MNWSHVRTPLAAAVLGSALSLLAACSGEGASGSAGAAPTFHKDVEPILQKSCRSCHSPGRIAPFSLASYADAKVVSKAIAGETAARRMPPWGAFETDECNPPAILDDMHLTPDQIRTLEDWDAAGAPEGDPADAPPPFEPPPAGLEDADIEVRPKEPFSVGGESDQFRCFVIDPGFTGMTYLNGYQVIAGNPAVVHHVLIYVDPNRQSEALMDASGSYDCFGGPGLGNASILGGWAPGMAAVEYGADIGAPIAAGALLVMQVHYHPAGAEAAPDSTALKMRFSDAPPTYRLDVLLIGNAQGPMGKGDGLLPGPGDEGGVEFRIPAGAAGHVERMNFTLPSIPVDVYVYGAAHHMHYVGTDMKTSIVRATPIGDEPTEECLLQTPQWDFTWQRSYIYDAPLKDLPKLRSGDMLKIRCTYDNTMDNPFVAAALAEQQLTSPVDVELGEATLDEMCLTALPLVRLNQ